MAAVEYRFSAIKITGRFAALASSVKAAPAELLGDNEFTWNYCDPTTHTEKVLLIGLGFAAYGNIVNNVWITVDAIGGNMIRTVISIPCSYGEGTKLHPFSCGVLPNLIGLGLNFIPLGFVVDYSLHYQRWTKCQYYWTKHTVKIGALCASGYRDDTIENTVAKMSKDVFGPCTTRGFQVTDEAGQCFLMTRVPNRNSVYECMPLFSPASNGDSLAAHIYTKSIGVDYNTYLTVGKKINTCMNGYSSSYDNDNGEEVGYCGRYMGAIIEFFDERFLSTDYQQYTFILRSNSLSLRSEAWPAGVFEEIPLPLFEISCGGGTPNFCELLLDVMDAH